eukprot:COSAG04_NODE_298_length_17490_cov_10.214249_19_plen_187_part_00
MKVMTPMRSLCWRRKRCIKTRCNSSAPRSRLGVARKTFQRRPQPANTAAGQRCHAAAAATVATAPVRPREVAGAMVYTGPPMQGNGPVLMENYLRKYDRPASAAASTARSGRLRPSSAFSRPSTSQRPGTAGSIRSVGSRGSRASNFSNASTYARRPCRRCDASRTRAARSAPRCARSGPASAFGR